MKTISVFGLFIAFFVDLNSQTVTRSPSEGLLEFEKREKEIVGSLKEQGVAKIYQIVIRIDRGKKSVAFFKNFLNLKDNSGWQFIHTKIYNKEIPSKEVLLETANQLSPQTYFSSGRILAYPWLYHYNRRNQTWSQQAVWGKSDNIYMEPIFVKFDEHPDIVLLKMAFKDGQSKAFDTKDVKKAEFYTSLLEELEAAKDVYTPPKLENVKPTADHVFKLEKGRLIKEDESYDASKRLVSYVVNSYNQEVAAESPDAASINDIAIAPRYIGEEEKELKIYSFVVSGFSLKKEQGRWIVVYTLDRLPAYEVGLRKGDILLKINSIDLKTAKAKEVQELIKADNYEVTYQRNDEIKTITFGKKDHKFKLLEGQPIPCF